jgi:transposase
MSRTDLSEQQWQALKPHLPENPKRGHDYRDHRQVINGILWRLKNGAPWREIPERYGPWQTCWDRFTRWERDGTWKRVLEAQQAQADAAGEIDWDGAALDSSHAKAHRSATGARKEPAQAEKRDHSR